MCESPLHKLIFDFSHEFSQIIDHGEYGEVHIDLVFPFMTKTSVMPVGFDLSENSLRIYRTSVSASQPFLRGEHLPCFRLCSLRLLFTSIVALPCSSQRTSS